MKSFTIKVGIPIHDTRTVFGSVFHHSALAVMPTHDTKHPFEHPASLGMLSSSMQPQ